MPQNGLKAAPDFELIAVGSGRRFRLLDYRGRVVLLIFADPTTARHSREIVVALRGRYPSSKSVMAAVVVDLRVVPGLLRSVAEGFMETAYRQAATEVPEGHDPADHLVLLKDWKGQASEAYKASGHSRQLLLQLIDAEGFLRDSYQGDRPEDRALQMVEALLGDG